MDFSNKRRKCAFPRICRCHLDELIHQMLAVVWLTDICSSKFRGRIFGDWLLIFLSDFTSLKRKLTYICVQKIKLDIFGEYKRDDSNIKLVCGSKYQKPGQMANHSLVRYDRIKSHFFS